MIIPAPGIFLERGEAPLAVALQQDGAQANSSATNSEPEVDFWDLLDVVNPLQHIPVVSSVYRHVSGDEIGGMARLLGGLLFGGPVGMVASAANLGLEGITGKDIGEHVMSAIVPEDAHASDTQLAAKVARAAGAYGEEGTTQVLAGSQLDTYDIEIPR